MSDNVFYTRDLRRRRLSPEGKVLLDELELAALLSPDGRDEPPSDALMKRMLQLAPSDRQELAAVLGEMALAVRRSSNRRPNR